MDRGGLGRIATDYEVRQQIDNDRCRRLRGYDSVGLPPSRFARNP